LNGKDCPVCGSKIFDWECLCKDCWNMIKVKDAMDGTKYLEAFLRGEIPTVHRELSLKKQLEWLKNKRKLMLRDLCTELCRVCKETDQSSVAGGRDPCQECKYYKYMNYLLSEFE